jgi:putative addiction module component (TIGR02574 family)
MKIIMGAITIEKQISNYVVQLSPKQKQAVLTVAKTFAEEQNAETNIWNDKDFIAEIERRTAEMESGKVKGYTWEEVKQRARRAIKNKKRK